LASAGLTKTIVVWDISNLKEAARFDHNGFELLTIAYSSDRKWLAANTIDYISPCIIAWDLNTKKEIARYDSHQDTPIASFAFSPNGKWLAAGTSRHADDKDRNIHLWEVESGKQIKEFKGHKGNIFEVAFSQDGKMLATGDGHNVFLWDLVPGGLPSRELLPKVEMEALWKDIENDDALKAYHAICRFASAPKSAFPFVRERFRIPSEERFQVLLKDLGADDYEERSRASEELASPLWEELIRKQLDIEGDVGKRDEMKKILALIYCPRKGVSLTISRATQALEFMGTAEAKAFLESLGTPDSKAASKRMKP
jgi:hypothetical protein